MSVSTVAEIQLNHPRLLHDSMAPATSASTPSMQTRNIAPLSAWWNTSFLGGQKLRDAQGHQKAMTVHHITVEAPFKSPTKLAQASCAKRSQAWVSHYQAVCPCFLNLPEFVSQCKVMTCRTVRFHHTTTTAICWGWKASCKASISGTWVKWGVEVGCLYPLAATMSCIIKPFAEYNYQ